MQLRSRASRSLLAGVGVVLPIFLVGLLGWQLVQWTAGIAGTLLAVPAFFGITGVAGRLLAGVGAVGLVFGGLTVIGIVVRTRLASWALDTFDRVVERVPVVGQVYHGLRNIRAVLLDSEQTPFTDVVLVELSDGVSVLGFTVGEAQHKLQTTRAGDGIAVYVPLAPNPTVGGHLMVVDPAVLTETALSRTEALTAIVTLGAGDDQQSPSTRPLRELYHHPPSDSN